MSAGIKNKLAFWIKLFQTLLFEQAYYTSCFTRDSPVFKSLSKQDCLGVLKRLTEQTRRNLWISEAKAPFFWSSPHNPQIVLRKILLFYGCPVFLSKKYNKPTFGDTRDGTSKA